jgi:hypothetical protein
MANPFQRRLCEKQWHEQENDKDKLAISELGDIPADFLGWSFGQAQVDFGFGRSFFGLVIVYLMVLNLAVIDGRCSKVGSVRWLCGPSH